MRHTKHNKQIVLDALWSILGRLELYHGRPSVDQFARTQGLCYNIMDEIRTQDPGGPYITCFGVSQFLKKYWQSWPLFSGEMHFPVPGGEYAFSAHQNPRMELWKRAQGEYRVDLIVFLIQQISKDLGIV